jgi:PRTRC genetic system ThiF family protein
MSRQTRTAQSGVHTLPAILLQRTVNVDLVGCGGNGSQMLTELAKMHRGMLALGHPGGLRVTAYDPDTVSEANVGRQNFSESDIGHFKAVALVHRLNCYYGLEWEAKPERYVGQRNTYEPEITHIVIGCVDTAKARREIHRAVTDRRCVTPIYWLDLGNGEHDGQVILGQPVAYRTDRHGEPHKPDAPANAARLRTVVEVLPDLLDESIPEDDAPSCSLAEALESQDLFVNRMASTLAMNLLWRLFRHGQIEQHGSFFNLADGRVNPLPVPALPPSRKKTVREAA